MLTRVKQTQTICDTDIVVCALSADTSQTQTLKDIVQDIGHFVCEKDFTAKIIDITLLKPFNLVIVKLKT